MPEFTLRNARSGGLTLALGLVVAIETAALHLLLARHHALVAWALTASSLSLLVWLAADYRRLGRSRIVVDGAAVRMEIGLRFTATIARDRIAAALMPGWRDLPVPGGAYLNATKPARVNILLTFHEPVAIRLLGAVNKPVRQIGLSLDDPAAFTRALAGADGAAEDPATDLPSARSDAPRR